jgi:hypothetical protein
VQSQPQTGHKLHKGQFISRPKGNSYKFRHDGYLYEVLEHFGSPRSAYCVCVAFRRVTSNVFGNGSKNVEQSGWRQLPRNGLKWREVLDIYLHRKKNNLL